VQQVKKYHAIFEVIYSGVDERFSTSGISWHVFQVIVPNPVKHHNAFVFRVKQLQTNVPIWGGN
jgi:hypothetical protein